MRRNNRNRSCFLNIINCENALKWYPTRLIIQLCLLIEKIFDAKTGNNRKSSVSSNTDKNEKHGPGPESGHDGEDENQEERNEEKETKNLTFITTGFNHNIIIQSL